MSAWLQERVTTAELASHEGSILLHQGYGERVPRDKSTIRFGWHPGGLLGATISAHKTLYQREIERAAREIDALVSEPYGLREEEIAIVDASINRRVAYARLARIPEEVADLTDTRLRKALSE